MMDHLQELEDKSVHILREAYANFKHIGMLWSIGKDSTVLLRLAQKAFFGHVPIPLVHIDTSFKIPEMIEYRNRLAIDWGLTLIVGKNEKALNEKQTFPDGAVDRTTCCGSLKAQALKTTLGGNAKRDFDVVRRYRLNHQTKLLEEDNNTEPFTGVIVGIRADEEGTRSKERYFSPRDYDNSWELTNQPPEFWNQYKTEFAPGTHLRIHPLLDWTELDIWEYIKRESIPTVSLYYDQGDGKRYRSLGCYPCTTPIESTAKSVDEIIIELRTGKLKNIAERAGRAQDTEGGGTLEALRKKGYM
jgi:sulfate adenylyltransferase subunit 2